MARLKSATKPAAQRLTESLKLLEMKHEAERNATADGIMESLISEITKLEAEQDRIEGQIDLLVIELQQMRFARLGRSMLYRKPKPIERHDMARRVYRYLKGRAGERVPPKQLEFLVPKEIRLRELVDYWNDNSGPKRIHAEGEKASRTYYVAP